MVLVHLFVVGKENNLYVKDDIGKKIDVNGEEELYIIDKFEVSKG